MFCLSSVKTITRTLLLLSKNIPGRKFFAVSGVFDIKPSNLENCQFHTSRLQFCFGKMNEVSAFKVAKQLAPSLKDDNRHKGQSGRIGVFGGSLIFTGAPYYAAISSLRVGADLVYVFCPKDAATVIKSYSPELMVMPVLDQEDGVKQIEPWIDRLHVVLIGPGLGREDSTFEVMEKIINICRQKNKPLVIDADGLFLIATKRQILKNYPAPVILTPNVMEFKRLMGLQNMENNASCSRLEQAEKFLKEIGGNVTILCKDKEDEILSHGQSLKVKGGGSGRRCGGQGDLLSGAAATFLGWSMDKSPGNDVEDLRGAVASFAAAKLTRTCNEKAFAKHGRSMICSDMILEIHEAFDETFELRSQTVIF
ncbi:unnamed protein product [Brassicogethes aeneus]|uniref:ATP-dependent (S)-NAD(P)H-hydrate dehydratase n=1 Tax=Brassicogethes aeneus TaxID=1431903 RepID=A0A9P0BE72_BRAAE|nr:unnamed protein product [Brassicogethes aeneus]